VKTVVLFVQLACPTN